MSAAIQPLTVIDSPLARPVSVVGVSLEPTDWRIVLENMPQGAACSHLELPVSEVERVIRERRPEVVLLPFDDDPGRATELAQRLAQISPGVSLLALAQVPDHNAIREAMRGGFRDYLVLPDDLAALRRTVREVAESVAPVASDARRGKITAIMGAKGGSGTTLLTVNLAAELADSVSALVLDMDFVLGDTAVFLDLSPELSMTDVLRNVARLDAELLSSTLMEHSGGMRVLPQPAVPLDDVSYDTDAVMRTLDLSAEQADEVVVDCGAGVNEATMVTVSTADRVLLVITPDVPSVRAAWIRLQLLERLDVPHDRIHLVVNHWGAHAGLSRREIEEHLGCTVYATINDDPKAAAAAVNEGQLLRERGGRAKITKDIAKLAAIISSSEGRSSAGGRASWFSFGRSAAK
jgi:pilus assembly protein CpaE